MEQAKSVRKRVWKTAQGEEKTAWIITYRDARGERCQETFAQKKTADARHAEVATALRAGTHVAPSKSVTVAEAGESWLRAATANGLEKSTRKTYAEQLHLHIVPHVGRLRLSEVSRRVISSLGALLADAQEQGLTAHNAVRDLRRNRHRGKERNAEKRQKGKLKLEWPVRRANSTLCSRTAKATSRT